MTTDRRFELTVFEAPDDASWSDAPRSRHGAGRRLRPRGRRRLADEAHRVQLPGRARIGKLLSASPAGRRVKDADAFAQRIKGAVEAAVARTTPA